MEGFAISIFMFLIGIAASIFYTAVVWRAMRAHERLAESIQNLGNQMQPDR